MNWFFFHGKTVAPVLLYAFACECVRDILMCLFVSVSVFCLFIFSICILCMSFMTFQMQIKLNRIFSAAYGIPYECYAFLIMYAG